METTLYNGTIEVSRDKKHRYWVKPANSDQEPEWYPGVTTILDKLDKSGPLIWWAVNCTLDDIRENVDIDDLDEVSLEGILEQAKFAHRRNAQTAASIGTVAHNWIEKYIETVLEGKKPPKRPKNEPANNAIDAYLKWEIEHDIEYLETERPIVNLSYKYAGTLDCIARIDGELGLLDFKTSSGIYVNYIWQLAAYIEAYYLETETPLTNNWIIKISKKDGEFETLKAPDNLWPDFEAFAGLLTVYKQEKIRKEWMKNGHNN